MSKTLLLVFSFFFLVSTSFAQEKQENTQELDSLQINLEEKGIVVDDALLKKKKVINPLAPAKAAFYSAVLPGLGQVYNKRYWKVPIVFAAIGTGVYAYSFNNREYVRYRDAFKRRRAGFTDDEFYDRNGDGSGPDFSDTALQDAQERFQRDRDLALLVTIALYALNIVDANVDAHLQQFNVDDDLSVDFQPYINLNSVTNDPNYGMALIIKF